MSLSHGEPCYCVDTSAFVDVRIRYPKDVFPGVWNRLSDLAKGGRMMAPTEVKKELERQADEVLQWAKMRRKVFQRLDAMQQELVREILARFPDLVDTAKITPDADPFIVALAVGKARQQKKLLISTRWYVVTQEGITRGGRPKIPNVCAAFDIDCIDLLEMFRLEGWTFQ